MSNPTNPRYAALNCPEHGKVFIGFSEYVRQMYMPNQRWKCPECRNNAEFDEAYFNQQHPTTSSAVPQERSKLEQSYTHEQVRQMVSHVMQYVDDLENAIACLGKPGSLGATVKAQTSRVIYQQSIKPFQHLRLRHEN